MGGFKKLMKNVVGSMGRVLGFAPAAPAPAVYRTGPSQADQAAALQAREEEALRRAELERRAEEARLKSETEARAADDKKKVLAAEEARRKTAVAASGRASTILAGENALAPGKTLLGG